MLSTRMEKVAEAGEKFRARLAYFSEHRRRELISAVGRGMLPEEQHMVLEDYLHISLKRRSEPLPLFKLQIHMIQDLGIAEKTVSHYKTEREDRLNKIGRGEGDKEQLEREIRGIERELHFNEAEVRAIRDIADGITWRLFDYDRAALSELANKPGKKYLNIEGIEAELEEFAAVFNEEEGIAVFNDLTHFLKLGDVTIRKNSGEFEIVEVKKGHKTSGRITRQKQHMQRTVTFLNKGEREHEEGRIVLTELNVVPETFHRVIVQMTRDAEKNGAAVERIGNYMVVECTDFMKAREIGPDWIDSIRSQAREWTEAWVAKGDWVHPFWSQERYLEVRNYAPFSVFPLPELARVKLMTGALWVVANVNISAIIRYIEERGWKVLMTPDELVKEAEEKGSAKMMGLVKVRKGPCTVEVPFPLLGRVGLEFLKPKTLVDTLEGVLASRGAVAPMTLISFTGEDAIWD